MEDSTKKNLRTSISQKRNMLTDYELIERSEKIKDTIFKMSEFKESNIILFYVSYGSEVSTHQMIKQCLSNGKRIIVPKVNYSKNSLLLSELNSWEHLEKGAYNILEPKSEHLKEINVELIDLMFIPGIVFDFFGNRIGHGKGYYDRLLNSKHKALHVGLAYELQMVEDMPVETHDVKVDRIITEKRVINCKKTT